MGKVSPMFSGCFLVLITGMSGVFSDYDGPVIVYHFSADLLHTYHIGMNGLELRDRWPILI